ncbi:MAG: hypothetical protein JWN17_2621, partial [Frankiales bacterium]|nr:hypothetical protein [Frankiales bacterium]
RVEADVGGAPVGEDGGLPAPAVAAAALEPEGRRCGASSSVHVPRVPGAPRHLHTRAGDDVGGQTCTAG